MDKNDLLPDWDPSAQRQQLEAVLSAGIELKRGDRVRLRPQARADIFDIALRGRTGRIASIEQDYENQIHVTVTIDDDPGADIGTSAKPIGHRFFFSPHEIELLSNAEREIK